MRPTSVRKLPPAKLAANRRDWDALVPYHVRARSYHVPAFLRGRSTLCRPERREVGPVRGKDLLHLQCHFGLDTLSWAREGARVTGVDFSPKALAMARELAERTGLEAEFIESDVHHLPRSLHARFDVVVATHGVLAWTPDVYRWFRSAAQCAKEGGFVYLREAHPLMVLLEERSVVERLRVRGTYFSHMEPAVTGPGSYAGPGIPVLFPRHQWHWDLHDVVNAAVRAGLVVEELQEHEVIPWPFFPWMREGRDGEYRMPPGAPRIPLTFSLKARKPRRPRARAV